MAALMRAASKLLHGLPGRGPLAWRSCIRSQVWSTGACPGGRGTYKQAPAFLSTRALRILAEQMICTARRLVLEAGHLAAWQVPQCIQALRCTGDEGEVKELGWSLVVQTLVRPIIQLPCPSTSSFRVL